MATHEPNIIQSIITTHNNKYNISNLQVFIINFLFPIIPLVHVLHNKQKYINNSNQDKELVLLGTKNLYNYDSKLYIDNTIKSLKQDNLTLIQTSVCKWTANHFN